MEAGIGIEPMLGVLQTPALPLGNRLSHDWLLSGSEVPGDFGRKLWTNLRRAARCSASRPDQASANSVSSVLVVDFGTAGVTVAADSLEKTPFFGRFNSCKNRHSGNTANTQRISVGFLCLFHLAKIGKRFAQSCTLLHVGAEQPTVFHVLFYKDLQDILRKTRDRQKGRWLVP